jgi:hypothetical protein
MNILAAIDKALAKAPVNTVAKVYEHLAGQDPAGAVTEAEFQGLRAAEAEWQRGFDATTIYTEEGARKRYSEQFANGKDHLDVATRTRGLESMISENAAKQEAAKAAMRKASCQAADIASAVKARLLPIAERALKARRDAEQAEAEEFGLATVHSALTTALAEFINLLRVQSIGTSGHAPRAMLRFINLK